jgi:hypothetical protein
MGKYSLENYNTFETYKIRPQPLLKVPENRGRGQITYLEFSWEELEASRGEYNIAPIVEAIAATVNPVLVIKPTKPSWLTNSIEECFASLIRRVGSSLSGNKKLTGVTISTVKESSREWEAYIDAFDNIPILVDLKNSKLIRYLKEKRIPFGLIVNCSEDNWIDCCEALARLGLQNTWEQRPVILHITDTIAGDHVQREHLRWHVGFSNLPMNMGYDFSLRRLISPKNISSKGALPLRFWFVNNGSAPCYHEFTLKILLQQGSTKYELTMNIDRKTWQLGDITHNEIVQLPEMKQGVYTLLAGIFFDDHMPMHLNLQGNVEKGFYELGRIEVDTNNRDDLFHAWDDFYPEGYYPLEDPKAPN